MCDMGSASHVPGTCRLSRGGGRGRGRVRCAMNRSCFDNPMMGLSETESWCQCAKPKAAVAVAVAVAWPHVLHTCHRGAPRKCVLPTLIKYQMQLWFSDNSTRIYIHISIYLTVEYFIHLRVINQQNIASVPEAKKLLIFYYLVLNLTSVEILFTRKSDFALILQYIYRELWFIWLYWTIWMARI